MKSNFKFSFKIINLRFQTSSEIGFASPIHHLQAKILFFLMTVSSGFSKNAYNEKFQTFYTNYQNFRRMSHMICLVSFFFFSR